MLKKRFIVLSVICLLLLCAGSLAAATLPEAENTCFVSEPREKFGGTGIGQWQGFAYVFGEKGEWTLAVSADTPNLHVQLLGADGSALTPVWQAEDGQVVLPFQTGGRLTAQVRIKTQGAWRGEIAIKKPCGGTRTLDVFSAPPLPKGTPLSDAAGAENVVIKDTTSTRVRGTYDGHGSATTEKLFFARGLYAFHYTYEGETPFVAWMLLRSGKKVLLGNVLRSQEGQTRVLLERDDVLWFEVQSKGRWEMRLERLP